MGYTRSLGAINKHFAIFKQVLTEPESEHTFQVSEWGTANRLAYQLREGMYAAQFHTGYEHIARLKETHKIKIENNVVRIMPKYDPEMIRKIQPIPSWGKYGSRKGVITCDEATTLIEVVSTIRDLNKDSPWDEILYRFFRFDQLTSQQRKMVFEMAEICEYKILDLEDDGTTLARAKPLSPFSSIYYDPANEEDYTVGLDTD